MPWTPGEGQISAVHWRGCQTDTIGERFGFFLRFPAACGRFEPAGRLFRVSTGLLLSRRDASRGYPTEQEQNEFSEAPGVIRSRRSSRICTELHGATRSYTEPARSRTKLHETAKLHGGARSNTPQHVHLHWQWLYGNAQEADAALHIKIHPQSITRACLLVRQRRAQSRFSAWTDHQITTIFAHARTCFVVHQADTKL
eukprot:gene24279-biopygen4397